MTRRGWGPGAITALAMLWAPLAQAQHVHPTAPADSARAWSVGAMAIGVASHVTPGALKTPISEAYLTQPMAFGSWRGWRGRVVALATLNFEAYTLRRGEITPGGYGEGYIDRRHPHTLAHELMVGLRDTRGDVGWSLFAGKGFVPFGSDDPMTRPFEKYPVNHHHAQLLERAMVTASARWRGLTFEGARFNGDEPEGPFDWPNRDRLFDSWASRATLALGSSLELSASAAEVRSPEYAPGNGLDQAKRHAALRWTTPRGRVRYALVEAASTHESSNGRRAFAFGTLLGEGEVQAGPLAIAARVERTTRPEEERLRSFYRTIRPLLDFNILGRTRWTNVTLALSPAGWGRGSFMGRPFVEVGYHVPRATIRPTALDPVEVFGGRQVWSMSAGVRVAAGGMRGRWGRY